MAATGPRREVAHRIFAAEYNASRVEIKGSADDRSPGYLVSPLGAKANRVFFCGVLTEVETVGESGDVRRARVSDPTGLFTLYAGQFQPEVAATLAQLQPPQYVAVVGKTRAYEPEPGQMFVSVRPESVTVVDEYVRNHWVVETVRRTQERIQAMKAVASLDKPAAEPLQKLGVPRHLHDGVLLAQEKYAGDVDLDFFSRMARDALSMLAEGEAMAPAAATRAAPVAAVAKPKGPGEDVEKRVLTIIEGLAKSDEKGAQWDQIVAQGQKQSVHEDQVEEALNSLMDKGLIYEPILGRLKMT